MSEKIRKTLYLPDWIAEKLDAEGPRYDGPGVVAATAIHAFCKASDAEKKAMLKSFRQSEIDHAYSAESIVAAAEADAAKKKQNRGRRSKRA